MDGWPLMSRYILNRLSCVSRFGEISSFWHYFNSLRRLCEGLFRVGKYLNLIWSTIYAIGQIFSVANDLMLNNNLTIWCAYGNLQFVSTGNEAWHAV